LSSETRFPTYFVLSPIVQRFVSIYQLQTNIRQTPICGNLPNVRKLILQNRSTSKIDECDPSIDFAEATYDRDALSTIDNIEEDADDYDHSS
jgi:hypothetical protein